MVGWGSFLSLSQMEEQVPVSLGLLAAGETSDSPAVVHEILQAHLAVRVVTRQDLQQVSTVFKIIKRKFKNASRTIHSNAVKSKNNNTYFLSCSLK
jgi:hypothetical protein